MRTMVPLGANPAEETVVAEVAPAPEVAAVPPRRGWVMPVVLLGLLLLTSLVVTAIVVASPASAASGGCGG
jgi:hypothetical protein